MARSVLHPEKYARYNPGSIDTIMGCAARHGLEVLGAGPAEVLHGPDAHVAVVFKAPSSDAMKAFLDDPDYAAPKAIRLASTANQRSFLVDAMPG